MQQSYKNHTRFHPPFHYLLLPLAFAVCVGGIFTFFPRYRGGIEPWTAVLMFAAWVTLLTVTMLTRTYAKQVQDRVIRTEERLRHYMLTGRQLDSGLTLSQIIALRFASDEEFPELCDRTMRKQLSPDEIKKSIRAWRADHLRI